MRTGTGILWWGQVAALAALALLLTALAPLAALEVDGTGHVVPLPDAAQRARELPVVQAQIADPEVGIDQRLLLRFALLLAENDDRPVSGVIPVPSGGLITTVDAVSPSGVSRYEQAVAAALQAWPRKTGDAWLTSWRALRDRLGPPTAEELAALPANLALASPKARASLRWGDSKPWVGWGSPALTAFLLAAIDGPVAQRGDADVRSHLLRKLYESDPSTGRSRILQAMHDQDETFTVQVLLLLPDETLPELDQVFRSGLRDKPGWGVISCAARYGSAAILEDVRAFYGNRPWACDLAEGMLRYLVKYDRAAGLQLVREAMAQRTRTGCYRNLLPEVLPSFPGEDVDRLIEGFVRDPEEDVAREAVRAISLLPAAQVRLQELLERSGAELSAAVRMEAERRLEWTRKVHRPAP